MVPGGGTAGLVVKPSITGNTGMTGRTGSSLPWVLSDMGTHIRPIRSDAVRYWRIAIPLIPIACLTLTILGLIEGQTAFYRIIG
jgi:hypothetical protein